MEDHEQAWGGFRFSGRIRKDGSILLKRKAVSINLSPGKERLLTMML